MLARHDIGGELRGGLERSPYLVGRDMEKVRSIPFVVDLLQFGLSWFLESLGRVTLQWFRALFATGVDLIDIGSVVEAGAKADATSLLRVDTVANVDVVFVVRDVRRDLHVGFWLALNVIASSIERGHEKTGIVLLQSVVPVFLVCEDVVEDARVPFITWSKYHVW